MCLISWAQNLLQQTFLGLMEEDIGSVGLGDDATVQLASSYLSFGSLFGFKFRWGLLGGVGIFCLFVGRFFVSFIF